MSSWDYEKEMQFLEYYRAEGSLWNPRDVHYTDIGGRSEAWARIAKCLNVSVKEVKRKKDSLLCTYRKIRRSLKGDEVVKPSWFAYEYIDKFLGDVRYKHNRSLSRSAETGARKTGARETGAAETAACESETSEHLETGECLETGEPETVKQESEAQEDIANDDESETFYYRQQPEPKRRREDPLRTDGLAHVRQAASLLSLVLKGQTEEDECDLYCKLLACKLKKLPEMERYEMMHKIDGLLLRRRRTCSPENYEFYLEDDALRS